MKGVILLQPEKLCAQIVQWLQEQVYASGGKGGVFGLSGGLDSAVVAGLCKKAFGTYCLGVIMPCLSQEMDTQHALEAANSFALPYQIVNLDNTYYALLSALNVELAEHSPNELALANIKPRLRMTVLYYYAAVKGYRVMGTGNKSEIYIGYFTKHGDGAADLEPLGDLTKSEVKELGAYLGVPRIIIEKKPTAGLWEGQTDEGEMGFSYEQLDRYLKGQPLEEEIREKIVSLHDQSEHKRLLPPIFQRKA